MSTQNKYAELCTALGHYKTQERKLAAKIRETEAAIDLLDAVAGEVAKQAEQQGPKNARGEAEQKGSANG